MFDWAKALRTSRPRFWIYLLGPFAVGTAAALPLGTAASVPLLALFAAFFAFPANLLLYGVNDLFDYDTDRHNPKKADYESLLLPADRAPFVRRLALVLASFVPLAVLLPRSALAWLGAFVALSCAYSVPPVRAKARPVLDALTNVLYVCPALVGYFATGGTSPDWRAVLAACLWAMAMHAYSAVPDIDADRAAGLRTVATWLGLRGTLLACAALYGAAAALAMPALGAWAPVLGLPYVALVALSLTKKTPAGVFGVYAWFPWLNAAVGAVLFFIAGWR
jgi:4-hydroxybenzoate polyprenyltransferase